MERAEGRNHTLDGRCGTTTFDTGDAKETKQKGCNVWSDLVADPTFPVAPTVQPAELTNIRSSIIGVYSS